MQSDPWPRVCLEQRIGPRSSTRWDPQHSHPVTVISVVTALVMILIVVFDLKSASDPGHTRIPSIYLAYLAVGIAWYKVKRRRAAPAAR